ncbi:MAG: hypothetical protein Q8L89_07300 [Gammaproteobacteria bacterium]|nr:hypothetical protein [Gammaproteobacteria bacterium]
MSGDDAAAGVGGVVLSVLVSLSWASMAEVVVVAWVGGIVGVGAKYVGEWCIKTAKEKWDL